HDRSWRRREASAPHRVAGGRLLGVFLAPGLLGHRENSEVMSSTQDAQKHARRRLAVVLLGGIAGVAVGLAGIYGIALLTRNAIVEPICAPALETARAVAPHAKGEVAAMSVARTPKLQPFLEFQDGAGQPKKLTEWRGRT